MNRKILSIAIIFLVGIFSHTKGINWGVSDNERISLVFGDHTTLENLINPMLQTHQDIREMQIYYGAPYPPDYNPDEKISVGIKGKKKSISREFINSMRSYLIRSYGADEQAVLASLSKINPSHLDFNPHFFEYGGIYLYPLGAFLKLCSMAGLINVNSNMSFYFKNPGEMGRIYTLSRIFGVLSFIFATIIFYLLCLLISKNQNISLVMAILFSITPGFVMWSHYLKPYTGGLFWVICTLYGVFKFFEKKQLKWMVVSSICSGFALSSVLSYGYVFFTVILSIFFVANGVRGILKNVAIAFICFIFSYFLLNPYVLLSFNEFVNELSYIQSYWRNSVTLENLKYFLTMSLRYGLGTGVWLVSVIFLIFSLYFSRDKQFLVILLSLLPAVLYFGIITGRWVHYSFVIYPYIFLIILFGATKIGVKGSMLILLPVLIFTFIFSFAHVTLFCGKNIRSVAGDWVNKNIPENSSMGLLEAPSPWRTPPFQFLKYDIRIGTPEQIQKPEYFIVSQYQWLRGGSFKDIKNLLADYEIIKEFRKEPVFLGLKFRQSDNIPYDWCHPNPIILIWKRKIQKF
ncbi:MAG TPA: glycosyltransferase family 39 protein [bacterium]|nr:glycosyltransferase family 39 protein [bacterium]